MLCDLDLLSISDRIGLRHCSQTTFKENSGNLYDDYNDKIRVCVRILVLIKHFNCILCWKKLRELTSSKK